MTCHSIPLHSIQGFIANCWRGRRRNEQSVDDFMTADSWMNEQTVAHLFSSVELKWPGPLVAISHFLFSTINTLPQSLSELFGELLFSCVMSFNVPHTMQNSLCCLFVYSSLCVQGLTFFCCIVQLWNHPNNIDQNPNLHVSPLKLVRKMMYVVLLRLLLLLLLHPGERVFVCLPSVKSPTGRWTRRVEISINFIEGRYQSSVIYEGVCLHFSFWLVPFEIKEGVGWEPSACSPTSDNTIAPLLFSWDESSSDCCPHR